MTEVEKLTGATPYLGTYWKSINWKKVEAEVRRLQRRIAKAVVTINRRSSVKRRLIGA